MRLKILLPDDFEMICIKFSSYLILPFTNSVNLLVWALVKKENTCKLPTAYGLYELVNYPNYSNAYLKCPKD